jgi:transketolase
VPTDLDSMRELSRRLRAHALRMVHAARSSHIGTCLSMADILAVLYGGILRVNPLDPKWQARDRLVVSKGHGAAIVYAVLAECGFFSEADLSSYCRAGSPLTGHINHHVPGVDVSTGSLGHGLSIACGMALAARRASATWRTFAILSDGELDEGSTWEAALLAQHHRLDNLVAIVDYNKIQSFGLVSEVIELEPLAAKWRAFNWGVREVDGHDHALLTEALGAMPIAAGRPSVLIAHTTKGKGVPFMEGNLLWHYRSPNDDELATALRAVSGSSEDGA